MRKTFARICASAKRQATSSTRDGVLGDVCFHQRGVCWVENRFVLGGTVIVPSPHSSLLALMCGKQNDIPCHPALPGKSPLKQMGVLELGRAGGSNNMVGEISIEFVLFLDRAPLPIPTAGLLPGT